MGTRTPVNRTSQCVFQPRPACPITGTARTISTPGVSAGTRIIVPRRCWLRVRVGDGKHDRERGTVRPCSRTTCARRSPTRRRPAPLASASSVGSEPATSGSVIAKNERASPATSGRRNRSFWSSVPNRCRISALPASGAWHPNTSCAYDRAPDLLVEARVVEEAEARAARLRRDVRRPQAPHHEHARASPSTSTRRVVVLALDRRLVRVDVRHP